MLSKRVLQKNFSSEWYEFLKEFLTSDRFNQIIEELSKEEGQYEVLPEHKNRFRAFRETPLSNTKAVLIGMDPYPTKGVATGLSFGISSETKRVPPSLKVISEEVKNCTGNSVTHFSLEHWAKQGILMLNSALTVRQGKPGSHSHIWSDFSSYLIRRLNDLDRPLVFILWGKDAKNLKTKINQDKHIIIESCHPIYERFSGGKGDFLNSNMFNKINECLRSHEHSEIVW